MQPRPIADTSRLLFPSLRFCTGSPPLGAESKVLLPFALRQCTMRQDLAALPHWVGLLFGRGKLALGSAQLVLNFGGYGFAVGTYCHTSDGNHLPVTLIGFLNRVLSHAFHGDAGDPGVTLVGRVRAIQFRNIGLPRRVRHAQTTALYLESDHEPVVGNSFELRGPPGTRNRMRSRRTLRHLCDASLAGDRGAICVAAVTELESCGLPVARHDGFGHGDGLPILLVDFLNGPIIHHFDTDRIVVRVSADRLVLTVRLYINRWRACFAVIHAVLQQKNVGFLRELRVAEIKLPRTAENTLGDCWNGD